MATSNYENWRKKYAPKGSSLSKSNIEPAKQKNNAPSDDYAKWRERNDPTNKVTPTVTSVQNTPAINSATTPQPTQRKPIEGWQRPQDTYYKTQPVSTAPVDTIDRLMQVAAQTKKPLVTGQNTLAPAAQNANRPVHQSNAEKSFSGWQYAKDIGYNFLYQIANMGATAFDLVEQNTIGEVAKFLVDVHGGNGDEVKEHMLFHRWKNELQRAAEEKSKNAVQNISSIKNDTLRTVANKGYELGGSLGPSATMAALALMTGGVSLGATGSTAALQSTAYLEANPGLVNTLSNAMTTMAKDPNYWGSFAMTVGPDYDEAKKSGATDEQALVMAVSAGLINAAIEIGGTSGEAGLQSIPSQVKGGKTLDLVKNLIDEGKEEVLQGLVSRTMENLAYNKGNPVFSTTDENAIINPVTSAKEFAGGVLVSAILGPAEAGIVKAAQHHQYSTAGQMITDSISPENRESLTLALIREGTNAPAGSDAYEYASRMESRFAETGRLSNAELGRLYGEVSEAMAQAPTTQEIAQKPEPQTTASPAPKTATPTGTDTVKEFSETLGKAGQTVFPAMYNNDGDPISYIEQMAKAYNAGQKGTVTPEEWEQVTKPSLVATGGANTEQIQAAYIAGQADAGKTVAKPDETVQNKSESVEEAKADLKKAIRVPIEGKNEEALAYGAENGDLSMDSVKITGNVPGFTDQQRFSLVEQIIEGAQTKAEKITADVPEDGTFRPARIKGISATNPEPVTETKQSTTEVKSNEQKPERTENGREDIRGGNTGRAGVSKTGEAPAEGRSVSAGGAGGENGLRPNGGNDEGAGARGGRSDASGGLQSGSDAGNAGQKAERAVSEQEHGERPVAGRSSANAVKPKANNKHNHRITEDIDSTRPSFSDNIAAIKLLKTIMNEGRTATPEERAILARYKGWGGIKDILLEHTYHANELKRYVTDEEYEATKLSVLNAHYTSTKVISAMYDAVKRLGFTGGRVLEPSMGVGNFFGMMPEKLARASELYGVELDTITGNIAKLLYPDAKIDVAGFQDVLYPDGTFDLVIGNVPFSNDIKIPYRNTTFNLHDFFFIKTLDETRPGGIVALITSTGTLDKISGKTQRAISDRANLIAAFRLPDTTFETNAGTEVTTDLIFLQKKGNGIEDNGVAFEKIGKIGNIPINEYYVEHPKNILGKLAVEKNMYGSDRVVVHGGSAAETQALLEKALKTLPRDIMNADAAKASNPVTVKRKGERARSTFTINADGTASITNEKTGEVTVFDPKTKAEKKKASIIKGYVEIKRTFDSLIDAEKSGNIEGANEYRKRLNEQYDRFRNEYGTLSNDNKRLLSADDDFVRITGLEIQKNDSVEKSPIFDRPTVSRARRTSAGSSDEALSIVLNEDGRVDIDRIAQLTGKSKDEALADLAGEVVYTPDGDYVLRAQYVSGNIYEKLAQVEGRPEFAEQKKMLEAALPRPRGVGEVNATLGAHWIDPKYISEFIKNTFQMYGNVEVAYNPLLGAWDIPKFYTPTRKFSTDRVSAYDVLKNTLAGKNIVVRDTLEDGSKVLNRDATAAAQQKQADLRKAFEDWIFTDKARTDDILNTFNRKLNAVAPMDYTSLGERLDFGIDPSAKKQPRSYQKTAAARIVFGGNALLHHGVGTGKTLSMIIAAHVMKQNGLANKPLFVVPNGKVNDFRNEILELYPDAKVLALDNESMTPKQIQRAKAQIATGDWDYVIIYHSAFGKLSMKPETEAAFLQSQLDRYEDNIRAGGKNGVRFEKGLKTKLENLKTRIKTLLEAPKDDTTHFEDMGIDALFVDEAHNFKKVGFATSFQLSGIDSSTNGMTTDLYMKENYMRQIGGKIVLATATPITNTLSEMYNMAMHVAPEVYENAGINTFDTWLNSFALIESQPEIAPDGKTWRMKERVRGFKNGNELIGLYRQFADVVQTKDVVKDLPEAEYIDVICKGTDYHQALLDNFADRSASAVRGGKDGDNMLVITSDGRAAGTDLRLLPKLLSELFPGVSDFDLPDSKINKAVRNIVDEYHNSSAINGTQFVFLDIGIRGGGKYDFNLYEDLINKLVKNGIPRDQIANIQDYDGEEARTALYDAMNSGAIRVLIGSTQKMGEGVNAQKRAVALHHLSVPYRPDNLEQREGRIIRFGNINKKVRIYRYIQEKSFDSYMWQMIERKAAYTAQALNGGDATDLEEVGDIELKAREAKGIATGNPLIVEKMTLQDKADKLGAIYRNWQKEQYEARAIIDNHPRVIEQIKGDIENVEHDLETIRKNTPADFSIKIGNATYDNRADAAKALAAKEKTANVGKVIGNYRGLDVVLGEPSFGDAGKQVFGFTIRGDYAYSGKFGDSEAGNISRVVNMVNDGIEKEKTILKTRIGNLQKELAEAKETVKRPFAQQEEYDQVKARQLEVDQELGIIENEAQVENETAENASGDVDQSRGATMPRPQDWTAKRIKYGKATEARPLSELIAKMEHDFGLNVTFGHVRGSGVRGTFNPADKGLRSKMENDLPTISHELGHWLDNRFGIRDTAIPDDVKKEFEAALGPGKSEYPNKKKWVTEGIAEFVRRYLQNRDTASIDFPEATKYFLGMMDAKSLALFQNFADEINAVYSLDADTATSSVVSKEKGTPDFRTPAEKAQDAYNRFRMDYIDTNDPIRRLDRITGGNAYIYATNAAHSSAIAERLLKSDLVDLDGQYVGPGLKSALQGVNTNSKKEWQDFNEYLVMLHGPERLAAGKRVFANDAKNNAAFMDSRRVALEKQYPAFRGAAERLIRFENDLVYTWGVKTGLISEDLFRTWKKIYKHHVPLNRVIAKGSFSTKQKRGFANQSSPLRRAKGSGLDIYYPVENIMDEVAMLVHAGLHNNVYRIVCDEATNNNLEALYMEKIATPMKPHKFNVSGLKTQIKNEVHEGTMRGEISDKSAESINKVLENIADVMTQYERGKAGGDIVTVMRDGTPEFWKVNDPLLLEALTNMTAPKISGVMKFFAVTTRFIQSNITGRDVIWGIFSNAPRDIMTLMHYTQFKDRPVQLLKAIGSTYVNAFREMYLDGRNVDPLYLEFLSLGGKHTGKHTADSDFYESARRSFTQTNTQRVLNAINPINAVGFVSDTIEMGPRFATYKLLRQQGVSQQKAFYEAMDITVNFYKGGRVSRDISKFIPYFNANVQGTDKFARYYTAEDAAGKENRTRVIRSRVLGLLASGLILGALEYIINNADDEKKKDYQQLSNYTKNSYFNIPTGDGKYFSIPKGRELDVWTSMVERAMETWIGDNKHAFDEFYEYAVDNFLPSVASDVAEIPSEIAKKGVSEGIRNKLEDAAGRLGLLGIAFNIGANRDFLGKPIESQSDRNLLPKDRYNQNSSKLAYWLGQAFGVSPKMTDYAGQQTLGFMWKYQKAVFPVDASRRDATLGVKNRYVKDNVYSQDLVNWLYDKKDQSEKDHANNKADVGKAITAKTDNAMTTFYARFNSINKGNTNADSQRAARQTVLNMIDEYRTSSDAGAETRTQSLVYDIVRKSGATELLPSTMQTYINAGGARYDLSDSQYVEYQTLYNGFYWTLAENALTGNLSDVEKRKYLRQIKELAKEKASDKIMRRAGVKYEGYQSKYPGVEDKDIITFEANVDIAKDGKSLKQDEVVEILKVMVKDGLEYEDAYTLYHTRYESDKNNPWKRYKP